MSEVTQTFRIEDIPADERLIGADPLWEEDPTARAAYSDNPGFTDGTEAAHPIHSAEDSILARPEIAEALEQVHLTLRPSTPEPETPVRTELAVPGLSWLKQNLGKESSILRTVKRQHNILAPQEERRQEMEARKRESAAEYIAEQQARQAKAEAERAHQAECAYQLDGAIESASQRHPRLNFDNISRLAGKLSSHKEDDGELVIDESKDFQKAIERQAETYMADPRQLIGDFRALSGIGLVVDSEPDDFDIVYPYIRKIGESLDTELNARTYEDFSEEVMDRWFSIFDTTSEASDTVPAGNDIPKHPIPFSLDVIDNSFSALSRSDPHKFIDRLHAFAAKGLSQPDNKPRFKMAYDVIRNCIQKPLAYHELMRATSAVLVLGNTQDEFLQRAVDLTATLEAVGLFQQLPATNAYDSLSIGAMKILDKICPEEFLSNSDERPALKFDRDVLKITMEDFRARALSPEGRETTLYGNMANLGWVSQDPAAPGGRIQQL